ncbi:MAG TPA: potassium transporter Kup [Thermodesulfobacteriota bacterium]|nr:potassium transporter Kup [Thermodesulfobacteriota bacterium]
MIAALGVVYGDIGTSPLYAVREAFQGPHGVAPTGANVLGVLSLVFWSLVLVVSVKYLVLLLRADNRGEGGIFALLALVPPAADPRAARLRRLAIPLGLFGAALLYGDGIITPAISVLSAVEGLAIAAPAAGPAVVPVTVAILLLLFLAQRRGTGGIGRVFGPIMLLWFAAIGGLGARALAREPAVVAAVNPLHAVRFFAEHGAAGFAVLGAVVLVVTGSEALYADLGHFGRRPIRIGWFAVVLPALLLSYFGQGAWLLAHPQATQNPFYALVPTPLLYPMVLLATLATIIASQALISGAFSLTHQAVQLGYWPRVTVVHTSAETEGQIYIPEVNYALMVACVGLVLAFRESSGLAAAYGLAVTGTMTITSLLYTVVLTETRAWPLWRALAVVGPFLTIDLAYLGATLLKFADGGWIPLLVAAGLYTMMTTWREGRAELARRIGRVTLPIDMLLDDLVQRRPHRVPGTAVFLSPNPAGVPVALLHHLKHNQVLHEQVVLLSILAPDVPRVPPAERVTTEALGLGFFRVVARYGFMESPHIHDILRDCRRRGLVADPSRTTFYVSRETLLTTGRSRMARWRKALFAFLARNARPATAYFRLPPGRVVELGMQIEL